jgi:hypothetical protein
LQNSTIIAPKWDRHFGDIPTNNVRDLSTSIVDLDVQRFIVNTTPIHVLPAVTPDLKTGRNNLSNGKLIQISGLTDSAGTDEETSIEAPADQCRKGDNGVANVSIIKSHFDRYLL